VGKNCSFISPGPNFGSEPYLIEIGDNKSKKLGNILSFGKKIKSLKKTNFVYLM